MIQLDDALIQADSLDVLTTLKAELAERGINRFSDFKENGDNIQTNCPFHKGGQERKPSFGVNGEKNKCHCFTCGWSGGVDKLVSELFGYDDNGAYGKRWLMRRFNSTEIEHRNINVSFERRKSTANTQSYVTEEELDKYRYYHTYWAKRGITDEGLIELFDLGYDGQTNCITFPVRDISGNTLFVARRSVVTKYFNYPAGVEKPVYGLYELEQVGAWDKYRVIKLDGSAKGVEELYICESMIDALTCWQYGQYAVALNGLGTEYQFKQISELPCRCIVLATDNDAAGQRARARIRRGVKGKIIKELVLPDGKKDINELTKDEFLSCGRIF